MNKYAPKFDADFKQTVCELLVEVPNTTVVCRLLNVDRSNLTRNREKDPDFDAAVNEALEAGYDLLEEEARRRAVEGVVKPVFYKGKQVVDPKTGEPTGIREFSDKLLVELLRARKPKQFNPGLKIGGDGVDKVTLTFNIGEDK